MPERAVKAKKAKAAAPLVQISLWWGASFTVLMIAIVATGLKVVFSADDTRGLYRELGQVQAQRDELAADQSRLMLERSAWSSLQSIESIARSELGMVFPDQVEQVQD